MSISLECLRKQLEAVRNFRADSGQFRFSGMEDLLLQHGQPYTLSYHKRLLRGWPGACFQNCYRAAIPKRSKWIYVEGVATCESVSGLALPHAWLTRAETPGIAFDPTWNHGTAFYFGIPFQREYIRRVFRSSKRQSYGVLNAYWAGHPLFTGNDAIEDAIEDVIDQRA